MDYALFYNSVNNDRVYDADSFSDWLKKFFKTGVFSGELRVTAAGGMDVKVGSGYVNIGGKVMQFDDTRLTVNTADPRYYRIDSVIVERNDTLRNFVLKIVSGTAGTASTVAGVSPVHSGGVYQLVLAQIMVRPGATSIAAADITDTRANSYLCGIVTGAVTQMDFTQFSSQFDDYFATFVTTKAAAFEAWFENLQDNLDTNTAGHLQNEIDACVQQGEPKYTLDTSSGASEDDADLYAAITALGWESEVIES